MKRPTVRHLILGLTVVLFAVAAVVAWYVRPQRRTFYTDGSTIRRPLADAQPRDILWEQPVDLAGTLNSEADDYEPRVSADGGTLFFVRGRAGENADIHFATRTFDGWSDPQPLLGVNTDADELGPDPSADGRTLYFYSNRAGGSGGYDIWMTQREDGGWSTPTNLGANVNSAYNEYGPGVSPEGDTLYFASNRPGPGEIDESDKDSWPATIREQRFSRHYDIYSVAITDRGPGTPVPVDAFNTEHNEGAPAVSPAGDFVYFSSDRPGGEGGFDLYRSRLLRGEMLEPENLGSAVNTTANELDPALSLGGFGLHFSSDRLAESLAAGEAGAYDLFFTKSREVFTESDTFRASINWTDLWPYLLWLLWALLGLLLLLLLLRYLRSDRYRRLGLLAKCILASILMHLIILFFLTLWQVSTSLNDWLNEGEGRRVAIVSPSIGDEVVMQLRGAMTDLQVDTSMEALAQEESEAPTLEPLTAMTLVSVQRAEIELPDEPTESAEANDVELEPVETETPEHETEMEQPTELAVSTPELVTPVQRTETAASIPETAISDASSQRAPSENVPDRSSEIDLSIAVAVASPELTAQQSVAEAVTARETTVQNQQPAPTSVDVARTDRTEQLDVETPDIVQPSTERMTEAPTQIAAETSEIARHAAAAVSDPAAAQDPVVHLEPTETPIEMETGSLASAATDEALTAPAPITLTSPSTTVAVNDSAATDVALPSAREAQTEALAEAAHEIDAPTLPESQRESGMVVAAQRSAESTLDVAPTELPAETESASLASHDRADINASSLASPEIQTATETALDVEDNIDVAMPSTPADAVVEEATEVLAEATIEPNRSSRRADSEAPTVESVQGVELAVSDSHATADRAEESFVEVTMDSAHDATLTPPPDLVPAAVEISALDAPMADTGSPVMEEATATAEAAPTGDEPAPAHVESSRASLPQESLLPRDRSTLTDALAMPEPVNSNLANQSLVEDFPDLVDAPGGSETPALPALQLAQAFDPSAMDLDLDLDLPVQTVTPPNPQDQRAEENRMDLVEQLGGSRETERAVALALQWLARHQSPNGRWDGEHFDDRCGECEGAARVEVDNALTGMALLCFLAADHTHLRDGPYRGVVRRGIDWLVDQQNDNGSLLGGESMYSHGIATIALAEAYGMTGDTRLAEPVRKAAEFIYAARSLDEGGWRYAPGQAGDTSVLGWQIMALTSARRAGIDVPQDAFEEANRWLDRVTDPRDLGLYAYQPDQPSTVSMTAEAMFVRQLLHADRREPRMRASAGFVLDRLPDWDDEPSTYYWYYGTLAMHQHQGRHWERWNEVVMEELLDHQSEEGRQAGSWEPHDAWSHVGGRVYQTAICTLTLEVYYRYLPRFMDVNDTIDAVGSIYGLVRDAETGEPLPGARIRLDRADGLPVTVLADDQGLYSINAPELPEFFALSASREGYLPQSLNIAFEDVEDGELARDFSLRPESGDIIAIEANPRVHHLGNNEFTGRINSQFQREAEGLIYDAFFDLGPGQLPPNIIGVELRLMAKGVQAQNRILINGQRLEDRLNRSPRDGSFGEFIAEIPIDWIHEGRNSLRIRSVNSNGDLDDFEFVNIQIHLIR